MRNINIAELKQIQLDILRKVNDFCNTNKIEYTLFFGTLLGAVRHQGYIPWDDDIDIAMTRENYEKFIKSFNEDSDFYHVYDYRQDSDYCLPYAKIADTRTLLIECTTTKNIGINIDLFPLDFAGNTRDNAIKNISSLNFCKILFRIKLLKPGQKNSFFKKVMICLAKIPFFFINMRKITSYEYRKINHLIKNPSEYMALIVDPEIGAAKKSIFKRELYEKHLQLQFEGDMFEAIADYGEWLQSVYGDYMKLPPVEKRQSPHTLNNVFWK